MKKKWIAAAVLASFALLIQGCAAGKAAPEPSALAQEQKPSIPAQEAEPSDLTKAERPSLLVQEGAHDLASSSKTGALHVEGARLLGSGGQPVQLRIILTAPALSSSTTSGM